MRNRYQIEKRDERREIGHRFDGVGEGGDEEGEEEEKAVGGGGGHGIEGDELGGW